MIGTLVGRLDQALGKVTMYRLVTLLLGALAVVMVAYTAAGAFSDPFTVKAELVTLAVLLATSVASSWCLALVFKARPHTESAVITGLLLFFLFWPSTDGSDVLWLAIAALLANASKYLLAWRGRHVFNPAAVGAFLVIVAQDVVGRDLPISATWWIAAEKLLPYVAVGALLVLWRTRRLDVGILFIAVASVLVVIGLTSLDLAFGNAVEIAAYSFPIVFLAGFMLTEPLTLPPRRVQQYVVAVGMALVFAYPTFVSTFTDSPPDLGLLRPTPELALLAGNIVAFAFARRRGVRLELVSKRQVSSEVHEFTFASAASEAFEPGQFAELTVPHRRPDSRGTRRSFSVSSPPSDDGLLTFGLRVPAESSSFKKALTALEPGAVVRATGLGGDFVWPQDRSVPLLLVAGGIGITPFLSQLRHHTDRDVVLVYGVQSAADVAFAEELSQVPVVLVSPDRPAALPAGWTHVEAPFISVDLITQAVPDAASRRAFVSGPPLMVDAVRPGLARACRGVKTDYFTGY